MKKVRMLGIAGAAPAVLGLAIPAANATVTDVHAQNGAGKTVSLGHVAQRAVCTGTYHNRSGAVNSHNVRLSGGIQWTGTQCVDAQWMHLQIRKTGLTERVRFYSGGGALERTTWQGGNLVLSTTSFLSYPDTYAHRVCQALVANSNHNDVKYGPLCWTTG
jgi:hypothetical protein